MGTLEKESANKLRRKNLRHLILHAIAVSGVIGVAMLLPNVFQAFKFFGLVPGRRQRESILTARDRLIAKGLVINEVGRLRLTSGGEALLRRLELKEYKTSKPKHWDGRWRVLIFDIPEKRKRLREQIRHTLVMIGFIRLQDSVWLYPYDCENLVTLLKADFKIGRELLYLIVDTLEQDGSYRKHFRIKGRHF